MRACFHGERLARCILEPDGTVVVANAAALALFGAGCGLDMRGGRIWAHDARVQRQLEAGLAAQRRRRAHALVVEGPGRGGKPAVCVLEPIDGELWSLVFWRPREKTRQDVLGALNEHFRLTPAQARVAVELVAGGSVKDIARKLRVSVETVRTHLRAIYAKMDVGSQTAVVATFFRFLAS